MLFLVATPAAAQDTLTIGQACAIDGDSLRVGGTIDNGRCHGGINTRLWGIDTPEWNAPHGRDAARALARLVAGKTVVCTLHDFDRFKRPVSTCVAGGVNLSREQVRAGWARDFARFSNGFYAAEEAEARNAKRGMWSAPP